MEKGTPRPWEAKGRGSIGSVVEADEIPVMGADGSVVAMVWPMGEDDDEEGRCVQRANAWLIAAAPDLLAALRDALADAGCAAKSCGHEYSCACIWINARAAIAKATLGVELKRARCRCGSVACPHEAKARRNPTLGWRDLDGIIHQFEG